MDDVSRWLRARRLYEALRDLAPEARDAELDRRVEDAGLRTAVLRLLDADERERPPDPAGHPDEGRRLGHYELRERIGEGGMARVYRAVDLVLDRSVALKLFSPQLTTDPRWLARFRREARATGAVNHPNILTVHEIGEADGEHYLATEYVEGETLRQRLRSGPLAPRAAVEIAAQVADALAAAHAAGLVHRDVKPENLMLRPDGLVKVLDFGLAKVVGPDAGAAGGLSPASGEFTGPGLVLGTLRYMSPEQARGRAVDSASDLFSLGVVLHEMLVGRPPFAGEGPLDVLVAILHDTPPAPGPELEDELPGIGALLARLLAKDPERREGDARRVAEDLRALRTDPADAARESPVRYAQSGDVRIAYQVVGDGPLDLVFVMGWVSHLEAFWSEPTFARFLERLSRSARLILFDKRGTGLSDRVPVDQLPTLEQRMDDVRAVMEAVGSERAVLFGVSEGGPMCSLFAATYPERTAALAMFGSYARRLRDDDYPWGPTVEERERFLDEIRDAWGGPVGLEARAPSRAADPRFRAWWAAYLRQGASPSAAVALTRMNAEIDIRSVLPTIGVPTLVLHRAGDRCLSVDEGRYLAARIPGARFVELDGDDHLPFVGDQDSVLDVLREFLATLAERAPEVDRVLATVLVADLDADAPPRLTGLWRREVLRHNGQLAALGPRGLRATFDGPARAIRAACAARDAARRARRGVRVGLHTGECDALGERLSGLAARVAERVAGRAADGEVLVSSTVRDLVAGAGLRLAAHGVEDCGPELGELRLFRAE